MKIFKVISRVFWFCVAVVWPQRKGPQTIDEPPEILGSMVPKKGPRKYSKADLDQCGLVIVPTNFGIPKQEHRPCPPYQTADGKETTATDPRRMIFYGSGNCSFWTDDWTKVRLSMGQIPVCPHCGQVGFQMEARQWETGAANFESCFHPGYVEFLATTKEKCFHAPVLVKYAIWAMAKGYTVN